MMVLWGTITILLAFVVTPGQFYLLRFGIGVAEAGLFPGIVVYLTHWIASSSRGRAAAHFTAGIPISFVIGSPLAAYLLRLNWLGLHCCRWLFIGDGMPAVIIGLTSLFYLSDSPMQVKWLTKDEREWIILTLEGERQLRTSISGGTWRGPVAAIHHCSFVGRSTVVHRLLWIGFLGPYDS
jgi:ACS family tartrate transporter-like MFS transporter